MWMHSSGVPAQRKAPRVRSRRCRTGGHTQTPPQALTRNVIRSTTRRHHRQTHNHDRHRPRCHQRQDRQAEAGRMTTRTHTQPYIQPQAHRRNRDRRRLTKAARTTRYPAIQHRGLRVRLNTSVRHRPRRRSRTAQHCSARVQRKTKVWRKLAHLRPPTQPRPLTQREPHPPRPHPSRTPPTPVHYHQRHRYRPPS